MPVVETTVETSLSPDAVRAALLDFSERRPQLWPGISPEFYEVYSVGETSALVREGTKLPIGTFWAKERYDWSDANSIRWTVEESNFSTPGSFVSATLEPRDGGTRVRLHWERTGTTLIGKLVARLIVATKGKPIAESFRKTFKKLEAEAAA